jgi:hypothetical protein
VSLDWTVTDPDSTPSLTGCTDENFNAETDGTTRTCSATDPGGNASASATIKIDTTKPVSQISCTGGCGGTKTGSVSVSLSATDTPATAGLTGSGVSQIRYTLDGSDPSAINGTVYTASFSVSSTTTVKWRAFDNAGNIENVGAQLIQFNNAPTVDAGGPYSVGEGLSVNLSGSGSDTDGDALTYAWDLDNNGTYETSGQNTSFSAATLDGPDSRAVGLQACDTHSACATDTATVNITNRNPSIGSATNNGPISEASSATVTVNASDPAGAADPLSYEFDCDGNSAYEVGPQAGSSHSCSFGNDGSVTVHVRVSDGDGGSATDSTVVTVNNVAPSISSVTNDGPVDEGGSVKITVSASDAFDSLTYAFDCNNDGTFSAQQASNEFMCTMGNDGAKTVAVKAYDDDTSTSSSTVVTVNNVAPVVSSVTNNGPINEGGSATITVNATDFDTLNYAFDCNNDGTYEVAPQASSSHSCSFGNDGSYTVRAKAIDDHTSTSDTTSVTVNNVAPAVSSVTNNGPINEGGSATITVNATDFDTLNYAFDCNNDGTYEVGPQASKTSTCSYGDNGSYTVRAKAIDDDTSTSDTTSVTVNNVAPTINGFVIAKPAGAACTGATNQVTVSFTVTDPADQAADPITGSINWGDGSGTQTIAGRTISENHNYAPGPHTINVTVDDGDGGVANAGGTTTAFSLLYSTSGILQPINMTGPRSAFKLGSTIPVKIKITDCNGNPVSTLSPQVSLLKLDGSPDGVVVEDFYSTVPDQGTTMRFTGSPDYQYIYNLGTKGQTQGDFQVTIKDPAIAPVSATFSLKK